MRPLHVIILAAGSGMRMKSQIPKVLHPICGRPMIAYAVDLAAASGIKQPVIVLGESVEHVKPVLPKEAKLVMQKHPKGTGDAVLSAKRTLGGTTGDVLILYADTPLLRRTTVQHLIEAHHKSNATCTLLTTYLADPTGYGRVVRDPSGVIVGVVEEAEANAQQRAIREVNVGPLCVKAQSLFEALAEVQPGASGKEWYLTQAITILAKREDVKLHTLRVESAAEAIGVNSRADLANATRIIRQRIIDSHLANGVTIVDPQTTYIDHGVTIGQDTVIYPGTVIESGVTIGKRCAIGPFARLRSGVAVSEDTRIGNFVELVRTKVGSHVHVNHVTYLGDATVEDDVNIGAGTITANYDGAEKHPVTIGKGAFIGCDTVLIAPVKIGPGAVTGAGSVIPKQHDVPSRDVVVGVPARSLRTGASKSGRGEAPAASALEKAAPQTDGAAARKALRLSGRVASRRLKAARPAARKPLRKNKVAKKRSITKARPRRRPVTRKRTTRVHAKRR